MSHMSHQLRDLFTENFPITITPALAKAIVRLVKAYEIRDSNPMAFNTYSLGVYNCVFKTSDRDDFFQLFNCDEKAITTGLMGHDPAAIFGISASEVRKVISNSGAVNDNFKVASDPFNLFMTYLFWKVQTSKLPSSTKYEVNSNLFMYFQYKFFTSLVNYRFPYKADEAVMTAMFEQLTNKFAIKVYGTWRKVMLARTADFLSSSSIHKQTIERYDDDKKIVYLITDVQSRIRNQINLVTAEFMRVKDENDRIGSYSAIGSNNEGEKVIIDNDNCFDLLTANVYNDSLTVGRFLNDRDIRIITGLFNNLNTTNFRSLLVKFSETAVKDAKARQDTKTKELPNGLIHYIGSRALIQAIVQQSLRYCVTKGIDLRNRVAVLKYLKDAYSASRTADPALLSVRDSVETMVLELQASRRESTVSALKLGFILYIVISGFKYLK